MDFNDVEKAFNSYLDKALVYFKELSNIGILGWSFLFLGLILLIVALFL
ncbi:MAG: hypothetical protein ACMXX6_00245 [Candidatus Woesearchaeota archaeon]